MKLLIVDDEALARQRLRRLLTDCADIEVVGEAADGAAAIEQARALQPDTVLMDIRMPGMDGITAARELAQQQPAPAVIFCTAYDDFAIQAFEAAAVGYLLKPVAREQLRAALERATSVNRAQLASLQQPGEARLQLAADTGHGVDVVAVSEVRYFHAEQKYVTAVHPGGELLLSDSLKSLETEFGERFVRVHRNALVAFAHITGLQRCNGGEYRVRLNGIDEGPLVSRRHLAALKKRLGAR